MILTRSFEARLRWALLLTLAACGEGSRAGTIPGEGSLADPGDSPSTDGISTRQIQVPAFVEEARNAVSMAANANGDFVIGFARVSQTSAAQPWFGVMAFNINGQGIGFAGGEQGFADGEGGQNGVARFEFPTGITMHSDGTIIVVDTTNDAIRRITSDWVVETVATVDCGAGVFCVMDVDVAADQTSWISGDKMRLLEPNVTLQVIADTGSLTMSSGVWFVAADPQDDTAVAIEGFNEEISVIRLHRDGSIGTIVGPTGPGCVDGSAEVAAFERPSGIAVDQNGRIFVADTGNGLVREILLDGTVQTLLGLGKGPDCGFINDTSQLRAPYKVDIAGPGRMVVLDVCDQAKPCAPPRVFLVEY